MVVYLLNTIVTVCYYKCRNDVDIPGILQYNYVLLQLYLWAIILYMGMYDHVQEMCIFNLVNKNILLNLLVHIYIIFCVSLK